MPRKKPLTELAYVQAVGDYRSTAFGPVEYIKIRRYDGKPLTWREVWEVFNAARPGMWALQLFPPVEHLVDDANIYHLFVLEDPAALAPLNIKH